VVAAREQLPRGAAAVSREALLGIDEGTTAVKAALFDLELRELASARVAVPLAHPGPGRVEQDPGLILDAVCAAVARVLDGVPDAAVVAAGLDHQGESVLAWDSHTCAPLTPVVTWQDKRSEALLANVDPAVCEISGLPLDPYFSAGKLAWLLMHDAAVKRAAADGRLRLGTVDSYLCARLGSEPATDLSTASRTQLLALGGSDWDERLLDAFGLRREWLPALAPTFGALGELREERWRCTLPLRARVVDQQAALAGSGAVRPGELKATFGTGVFVLGHTDGPARADGVLPTIAWAPPAPGSVSHALDGGVFAAGALLDWMARDLGLAADAAALAALAGTVPGSAGVRVLPALAGLGAPWWEPAARGAVTGLHGGARPAHLARAALEGIAWRVADVVGAIAAAVPVRDVRVDGGLTNDPTLVQLQADALAVPMRVGRADTTVLGAAMLAGVGAGVFADVHAAASHLPEPVEVGRTRSPEEVAAEHERWREYVRAAAYLR
jgi:glycerol kinase